MRRLIRKVAERLAGPALGPALLMLTISLGVASILSVVVAVTPLDDPTDSPWFQIFVFSAGVLASSFVATVSAEEQAGKIVERDARKSLRRILRLQAYLVGLKRQLRDRGAEAQLVPEAVTADAVQQMLYAFSEIVGVYADMARDSIFDWDDIAPEIRGELEAQLRAVETEIERLDTEYDDD